jgi:hypothetical protein
VFSKVSGQWLEVNSQWSEVRGKWSAVSGLKPWPTTEAVAAEGQVHGPAEAAEAGVAIIDADQL